MHRWRELYDLGLVAQLRSLVQPAPNPFKLHAVLGAGVWQPSPGPMLCVLKVLGSAVTQLLFALSLYVRRPFDDAARLEDRLAILVDPKQLAAHMRDSSYGQRLLGFLAEDPLKGSSSATPQCEVFSTIMLALVGAYYEQDGGGFYSAARLWELLDEGSSWEEYFAEIAHKLQNETQYLGRTLTHESFCEECLDGEQLLKVKFAEPKTGTVFYRRPQPRAGREFAQERREKSHEWLNIAWDPRVHAYSSVLIGGHLPNKVTSWVRGVPICALVKVKQGKIVPPPPLYSSLQERLDNTLVVVYKEHGQFIYSRTFDGGLGMERKDEAGSQELPLIFGEGAHALLSPYLDRTLPQKVCSWLRFSCLASIVVPRQSDTTPTAASAEVHRDHWAKDDDLVRWTSKGGSYTCQGLVRSCGLVYEISEERRHLRQELTWSEDDRRWEHRWENHPQLPPGVVQWLNQHARREDRSLPQIVEKFHEHARESISLRAVVPQFVKQLRKKAPQTVDMALASASLNHRFQNPALLLHAFNHPSNVGTGMPSNQRLAFVGRRVWDLLVMELLLEDALPLGTTQARDATAEELTAQGGSYVLPHIAAQRLGWPAPFAAAEQGVEDHMAKVAEELQLRHTACCNHLMYAHRCVLLKLHTWLQVPTSSDEEPEPDPGTDLLQNVAAFAAIVRRVDLWASRTAQQTTWEKGPWEHLVVHDAPRAVGDLFLACVGAVVIDTDWKHAKEELGPIVRQHVNDCISACAPLVDSQEVKERGVEDTVWSEMFKQLRSVDASERLSRVYKHTVVPPSPAEQADTLEFAQRHLRQLESAFACTDVHILEYHGQLIGATSPRSARLRHAYKAAGRAAEDALETDSDHTPVETREDPPEQDRCQDDGRQFCHNCDMWLNGPKQYIDHLIGKKHTKNLRQQARPQAPDETAATPPAQKKEKSKSASPQAGSDPALASDAIGLSSPVSPPSPVAPPSPGTLPDLASYPALVRDSNAPSPEPVPALGPGAGNPNTPTGAYSTGVWPPHAAAYDQWQQWCPHAYGVAYGHYQQLHQLQEAHAAAMMWQH